MTCKLLDTAEAGSVVLCAVILRRRPVY